MEDKVLQMANSFPAVVNSYTDNDKRTWLILLIATLLFILLSLPSLSNLFSVTLKNIINSDNQTTQTLVKAAVFFIVLHVATKLVA